MVHTKGTDMVALRKIICEFNQESILFEKLSVELQKTYKAIIATTWTPIDIQMEIYQNAAAVLFPNSQNAMEDLGSALARKTFSGIYKVFLRIPTLEFIMNRVAMVWKSYYTKGEAVIENCQNEQVDFVVRNFAELPLPMCYVASGHCRSIVEMTGRKNVKVVLKKNNPESWRWVITWKNNTH